jgi:hypothetical protein
LFGALYGLALVFLTSVQVPEPGGMPARASVHRTAHASIGRQVADAATPAIEHADELVVQASVSERKSPRGQHGLSLPAERTAALMRGYEEARARGAIHAARRRTRSVAPARASPAARLERATPPQAHA